MGCSASSEGNIVTMPQNSTGVAHQSAPAKPVEAAASNNAHKLGDSPGGNRNVSIGIDKSKSAKKPAVSNSPDGNKITKAPTNSSPSIHKVSEIKKGPTNESSIRKEQQNSKDVKPTVSPSKVSLHVSDQVSEASKSMKMTTSVTHFQTNNPETFSSNKPIDETEEDQAKKRRSIKKKGSVDPKLNELVKIYGYT